MPCIAAVGRCGLNQCSTSFTTSPSNRKKRKLQIHKKDNSTSLCDNRALSVTAFTLIDYAFVAKTRNNGTIHCVLSSPLLSSLFVSLRLVWWRSWVDFVGDHSLPCSCHSYLKLLVPGKCLVETCMYVQCLYVFISANEHDGAHWHGSAPNRKANWPTSPASKFSFKVVDFGHVGNQHLILWKRKL